MAEERKSQTADRLQGIAGALRETSSSLHDQEEDTAADYIAAAADQVEKFSGYLRNQNVGTLLHDVERYARRQPELFLAGALAAGFMLGRFFKSSSPRQSYDIQRYGSYPRYDQSVNYGSSQYNQSQYNQPHNQYGAERYGAPTYSGSYGAGSYSRYGASESQGRADSSGYSGQSGSAAQQYGRQNQSDWVGTSETAAQTAGTAEERTETSSQTSGIASQSTNAGQNRSGQTSSSRSTETRSKEE